MKVTLAHFGFLEYTVNLANALSQYVDLTLVQPEKISKESKDLLDPRIRIISFKKPRIRDPRNLIVMREMMSVIHNLQTDVLHVQETNDFWYDLMLLLNKMPPLVTTIHDVFPHPGDKNRVPGSEYTRRIAFYRSQQLIVHAELLKSILTKQFRVQQQQVNVLPHGELGSFYHKFVGTKVVEREPYTLLFLGRIWPYKGLKYLVEAIPLVAEKIPQVKLIIAGRGENLEQYFANGYDDKRYEILNRYIQSEEIANLFQRSTAAILPYIEASQSGVAAIAYAMGTPVIASDIGGLSEMVQHEKDGLLVPPRNVRALADAIIRLLSDRQLQEKIRMAALARCQKDLNWSNIAGQTVEAYRKAIYMKNYSQRG
jgi:glycosyltransferase involved in cell wall biosynthesis